MSKIISIGTAVPECRHRQEDILEFMQRVYAPDEANRRKLKFLYRQGGIDTRYSVVPDYSQPAAAWKFYPPTENLEPFPNLELRMKWYQDHAGQLSQRAAETCIESHPDQKITHLITVSCTGMSAHGLDIELLDLLKLPVTTARTSVNFMGCYAAIHALKLANAFCIADPSAVVLIVCTELCTLHFQKELTVDNVTSSMLFGDGAAAVLVTGNDETPGLHIDHFYSTLSVKGKADMAWELSSKGFLMTLSGYIPELLQEDFEPLVERALKSSSANKNEITHWCVHPGGKRILEAIHKSLQLHNGELKHSYDVLKEYGNMSSPTILFVLKEIMHSLSPAQHQQKVFCAAFGPGLTMETFVASY